MTFRYRRLDANGDMTFGHGANNFLADSPTAVAQAILTRLYLFQGEWFLDLSAGTPWMQQVLGKPRGTFPPGRTSQAPPMGLPDAAIRQRIATTPFVTAVLDYASFSDTTNRALLVSCKVNTSFGPVTAPPPGAQMTTDGALVFGLQVPQPQLSPQLRRLPAPSAFRR